MSLPPGFLDEIRSRLSLGQVVGRKVMWDARKSNQSKGDLWAPCPFHQEKTASFHVDDRKGFYYCFGCHAKGDAISFVKDTENVEFMEAVEILAGEAGMQMPARDPQARAKADRNSQLAEVMEMALRHFRMQLRTGAGRAAADYLAGRGLDTAAQDRWEIGFAADAWQGLWDHLTGKGVAADLIQGAGLAKASQKGGTPYDTFRNRIMFPIRDARGRCIAFGGRAMDPNDPAKYLNSPETELFDKGRSLYNLRAAREAAGQGHDLIVAEGYMDVIALSEAGFKAAVAPLGTAVTEHQLALMWRIAPEPIVALDGDTAGQRAAARLIDLALPALANSNSLFFLTLPGDQDPDDVLKSKGASAFATLVAEHKVPLVRALWEREFNASPLETPEQKAGLDKRLRAAIAQIPDPDIKRYYGEALKSFRWEAFRPANWAPEYRRGRKGAVATGPLPSTRSSMLVMQGAARSDNLLGVHLDDFHAVRERTLAAIAVGNVKTALAFRDGLDQFDVSDMAARTVLREITSWNDAPDPGEILPRLTARLGEALVKSVVEDPYARLHPAVRKHVASDQVLMEFAENIARISADRAIRIELTEASEDIQVSDSESITWRLGQSAEARNEAFRGEQEDTTEYEIAPSGAAINRDERSAFDALLESIRFSKSGR